MIQLQRHRASIPAKYRGSGLAKHLVKLFEAWYEGGYVVPFKSRKSLAIWKDAKKTLRKESNDKCAYCECVTAVVAHGDVEHFRPKSAYWWLAYSYDNYTYACQVCNQSWKGDKFPISGTAVQPPIALPTSRPDPATLATLAAGLCPDPACDNDADLRAHFAGEDADLPHPYLADTESLFGWRADDVNREVLLVARGRGRASQRAVAAAVDVLGLNREELRRLRYVTYENVKTWCLVIQTAAQPAVRKMAEEQLLKLAGSEYPFAGMTRHFLREWQVLA